MKSSFQDKVLEICTYILVILFIGLAIYYMEYGHHCNWKNCKYAGRIYSYPTKNKELELHLKHPTWSKEEVNKHLKP